ncbi:hypothetical protein F8388_000946 [Cannabis sativa]|uniref:RNase H type-1 domain-containing protein n=1 Tax=Cannabis sativa TaxID=3483 RepID=A0A7J6FSK7_CANSA|nr:hypothetical protein F8388_000946 [Cannabis sativa]
MFDLLLDFRNKLFKFEFEDVIKVLWALWEKQNRHWSNMPYMNGTKLLEWVFSKNPSPTTKMCGDSNPHSALSSQQVRWLAPPEGVICTHGNVALKPGKVGVGIGFVWGDWCGNLISAGMTFLPSYCTVAVAEAWAIFEALKALLNNETRSFEIRLDCKMVVEAVKEKEN